MINSIPKVKKINKLSSSQFIDTNAIYNENKFSDGVGEVNNIKGFVKNKIELPEEFVPKAAKKIVLNEQVQFLKDNKPIAINDKKALKVLAAEKSITKQFNVDPSSADKLDHEIYKYEMQISKQHLQSKSLFDDVVNRTQQYIKLFGGLASNSIFQNMAGLAARVIAPPPTDEQIKLIMERLRTLDPTIITDIYTISQIVQTPELLAYLRNLYEHVKNNVATNKDLQYVMNIVKPIVDYIAINSDKFSMSGSPWLMDIYNKIKGSPFASPLFTPDTPTPQPVTTAPTTYNFQSDSTASPMARHTDAPTQSQTVAAPTTQPIESPMPEPIPTTEPSSQSRQPLVGNMGTIYEAYTDAFTTREKLEQFYTNLLGVGMSQAFMGIKQYISRASGVSVQIKETPTVNLTTNLMNALIYIGIMPIWAIDELQMRATQINNDPSFFFQPLKTSQQQIPQTPQEQTPIQDYSELKNKIYQALENRFNLDSFIMDTGNKEDYLIRYPVFKRSITDAANKLDSEISGGAQLWRISSKILFDMIYNGLVSLNDPVLSEFISTIGNEMIILASDPKFALEAGDIPYDIKSERLPATLPRTATEQTRPQSTPQIIPASSVSGPTLSTTSEPKLLNLSSKIGPVPINKPDYFKEINQASLTKINKNDSLFDYISNFIYYLPNIFLKKSAQEFKKGKKLYDLISIATPYVTGAISLFTVYKASRSLFKKNIRLIQQDEEINPEQLIGIIANKPEWADYIQGLIGDNRNIRDYFKNPLNMYNFIITLISNFIQTPTTADAEIAIRDNIIETLKQELKDIATQKVIKKLIKDVGDQIAEAVLKEGVEQEFPLQKTVAQKRYEKLLELDETKGGLYQQLGLIFAFFNNPNLIQSSPSEINKQLLDIYDLYFKIYKMIEYYYSQFNQYGGLSAFAFTSIEQPDINNIGRIRSNYLAKDFVLKLSRLQIAIKNMLGSGFSTRTDQESIDMRKYFDQLNQFIIQIKNTFGVIPENLYTTKILTKKSNKNLIQ